jgi:hypothetical protein
MFRHDFPSTTGRCFSSTVCFKKSIAPCSLMMYSAFHLVEVEVAEDVLLRIRADLRPIQRGEHHQFGLPHLGKSRWPRKGFFRTIRAVVCQQSPFELGRLSRDGQQRAGRSADDCAIRRSQRRDPAGGRGCHLQNDQVGQHGAFADPVGDITDIDGEAALDARFLAGLVEAILHSKRARAFRFILCFHNMQAVQFCTLALGDEDRLIERVPTFGKSTQGDEDVGKETVGIACDRARFSPTTGLGLDASFEDQVCRGRIGLDLPPKLLLQRGAVLRDPNVQVGDGPPGEPAQQPRSRMASARGMYMVSYQYAAAS